MKQKKDPNIDELLNSFIDGELTEKEQTEVRKLISDDEQVEQRLRQLQKTKMLVGSLPHAEAPDHLLDNIKAFLGTQTLLDEPVWSEERLEERVGVRHLYVRKVLAAAAMIGLIAVLSSVIYTIVSPETVSKPRVLATALDGRLELKTNALIEVNAIISRVIEDNGLSDSVSVEKQEEGSIYSITCGREELNSLLADLADVGVRAEQIAKLITIPKPRLTKADPNEKPDEKSETEGDLHLTIVVENSE